MAGRSHNVAAQATTLGKRFATAADELLVALERLDELLARYPLRGIKGPVGTAQDMLDLLDGDAGKLAELEQRVAAPPRLRPGARPASARSTRARSTSTSSPRSCSSPPAPSSLATTIRLMAGHELVTEGFKAGPGRLVSAMPHKMNTRSCERVNGLAVVLRGYLSMVGELAGDQWNEGDVSCSVVRRVALPDAFFAADGLFETFLTVLDEFGAFPAVIAARARPLPAVPRHHQGADGRGAQRRRPRDRARGDQGARGRASRSRCASRAPADNDLFDRLAADPRLGLTARAARRAGRRPDRRSPAPPSPRSQAVVRRVERGRGRATPRPRRTRPAPIL